MTQPDLSPWQSSKRFGIAEYLPYTYWPTVSTVPQLSGNTVSYKETAPDSYNFIYDRTNRDMGTGQGYAGHIHPNYLDQLLDTVKELDRIDPNRYHYDLSGVTRQPTSPLSLVNRNNIRPPTPTLTGADAERIQQYNGVYDILKQISGSQ